MLEGQVDRAYLGSRKGCCLETVYSFMSEMRRSVHDNVFTYEA